MGILYLCVHEVHTHLCEPTCVCSCVLSTWTCVSVYVDIECFLQLLSTLIFETGYVPEPGAHQLRMASKPQQRSSCASLPSTAITRFFTWALEVKLGQALDRRSHCHSSLNSSFLKQEDLQRTTIPNSFTPSPDFVRLWLKAAPQRNH